MDAAHLWSFWRGVHILLAWEYDRIEKIRKIIPLNGEVDVVWIWSSSHTMLEIIPIDAAAWRVCRLLSTVSSRLLMRYPSCSNPIPPIVVLADAPRFVETTVVPIY